jgi:hypothetical protein
MEIVSKSCLRFFGALCLASSNHCSVLWKNSLG